MKLIVGLGNPGKEYEKTRHNAGFITVDYIQKNLGATEWRPEKKFKAEISDGKIGKEKIILAKPQTFMNKSGDAVGLIAKFYKIKPNNIFVIHDDTDLVLGRLKIKADGSAGGHNGIDSIIKKVGKDFIRFRIGTSRGKKHVKAEKLVLGKFSAQELKLLQTVIEKTHEAVQVAIEENLSKAMSIFNLKI